MAAQALTATRLSYGFSVSARKNNSGPIRLFVSPSLALGPTSDFRINKLSSSIRCSSNNGSPGPSSSENESKVILDAFFLGKAFGEVLNERIESTVGEFSSVIGQWHPNFTIEGYFRHFVSIDQERRIFFSSPC